VKVGPVTKLVIISNRSRWFTVFEFDRGIRDLNWQKLRVLCPRREWGMVNTARQMAPGIMRGRSPRARPLVLIIRYRSCISRIRWKFSVLFAREKKKKGQCANERKKESARGGCSRTRAKCSSFNSGAPISTDRIIHPSSPSPFPTVRFCIDMCLNFSRSSRDIFLERGIFCRWCTLYARFRSGRGRVRMNLFNRKELRRVRWE